MQLRRYGARVTAVAEAAPLPDARQPRQLIVTLYGLYAREDDGWVSAAALVRLSGS
jgi:phenylacetic acid degradation operon negative regulatory protein